MWLSPAKAFFDPASFQQTVNGHESYPPGEKRVVTGGVRPEEHLWPTCCVGAPPCWRVYAGLFVKETACGQSQRRLET